MPRVRRSIVTAVALACALAVAGCGSGSAPWSAGPARQASFERRAAILETRWSAVVREGVPTSAIVPLRHELSSSPFSSAPASSSLWLSGNGQSLLDSVDAGTAAAWTTAMVAARQAASDVMAAWSAMVSHYGSAVASADVATESTWPAQLGLAATPVDISALVAGWSAILNTARSGAAAASALASTLAPYGGLTGLESAATGAVAAASADHLDPGAVPASLAALQARLASGADVAPIVTVVITSLRSLRALTGEYSTEGAQLATLRQHIADAAARNTAHASSFPSQYGAVMAAYHAATTASAVAAVGGRINALSSSVSADLSAVAAAARAAQPTRAGCGHAVPAGKVIVVSVSQQSAAFYDSTCLLSTTPVTTGRPGMRTPTGSFRIFSRVSPAHFVSASRPGSPGYYTPETTRFAMGYEGGGYFLHDAPWEPDSAFGAGSENGPFASHGCIHIPTSVMAWLFGWATMGTHVIVTG